MKYLRGSLLVIVLLALWGTERGLAQQQAPAGTVYVVTHIDVTPANNGVPATTQLLHDLAAASKNDKGLIRFEVMVQDGRPNHFTVVEVWQSRAAFEAHGETVHVKQFREKIQQYMGSPFDERLHALVP